MNKIQEFAAKYLDDFIEGRPSPFDEAPIYLLIECAANPSLGHKQKIIQQVIRDFIEFGGEPNAQT